MKTLKESIFDDVEDIVSNDSALIEQFLKDNYKIDGSYTINENNTVDVDGTVKVKNKNIKSLTNGLFRFGKVKQSFYCMNCTKLASLEGAPKEVGEDFWCDCCSSLTSLEGAPEKAGGCFYFE